MTQEEVLLLFEQYHNMVYRLALASLRSQPDAEDVTQTVFLKLLEGNTGPMPGKEGAWLARVTVNACRDLMRRFWRRKTEPLDETIPFSQPEERTLFEAVMSLPDKYRIVVHLHYYEGYTFAETGKLLGLSPSTVSMRLFRARNMLRNHFQEEVYEKFVSEDV